MRRSIGAGFSRRQWMNNNRLKIHIYRIRVLAHRKDYLLCSSCFPTCLQGQVELHRNGNTDITESRKKAITAMVTKMVLNSNFLVEYPSWI